MGRLRATEYHINDDWRAHTQWKVHMIGIPLCTGRKCKSWGRSEELITWFENHNIEGWWSIDDVVLLFRPTFTLLFQLLISYIKEHYLNTAEWDEKLILNSMGKLRWIWLKLFAGCPTSTTKLSPWCKTVLVSIPPFCGDFSPNLLTSEDIIDDAFW